MEGGWAGALRWSSRGGTWGGGGRERRREGGKEGRREGRESINCCLTYIIRNTTTQTVLKWVNK